jgi:hypothetical protein
VKSGNRLRLSASPVQAYTSSKHFERAGNRMAILWVITDARDKAYIGKRSPDSQTPRDEARCTQDFVLLNDTDKSESYYGRMDPEVLSEAYLASTYPEI